MLVVLSFFSPYEPDERRAVARNEPPSPNNHGHHIAPDKMSSGC